MLKNVIVFGTKTINNIEKLQLNERFKSHLNTDWIKLIDVFDVGNTKEKIWKIKFNDGETLFVEPFKF